MEEEPLAWQPQLQLRRAAWQPPRPFPKPEVFVKAQKPGRHPSARPFASAAAPAVGAWYAASGLAHGEYPAAPEGLATWPAFGEMTERFLAAAAL